MKKIIILISCLIILIIGVFILRKDFPYDFEVVPGDKSLWIINITDWADRDCYVTVTSNEGQRINTILPSKGKLVKIKSLKNGTEYKIYIKRTDFLGRIKYRTASVNTTPEADVDKYIVLVGASVGKSWNLPELSKRMNLKDVFYGYRGKYEFDKSSIIQSLVKSELKPDIVIIKECAAYFPRETYESIKEIEKWVEILQQARIIPILATVVPITETRDFESGNSQMDSINKFNDAVRSLCSKKGILLLDLQEILSNSEKTQKYLDEKYATLDGLHLREETYSLLDKFLTDFINSKT